MVFGVWCLVFEKDKASKPYGFSARKRSGFIAKGSKLSQETMQESGLTLIEAMVAAIIVAIGFVGVFTMTSVSMQSMQASMLREELQMQANTILDVIEMDKEFIDEYAMDLSACNAPESDATETYQLRPYRWCNRIAERAGAARAEDVRTITVDDLIDDQKRVTVRLDARGGEIKVIVRRVYDS